MSSVCKQIRETRRITELGYPPFNVFDIDDMGKPFQPDVRGQEWNNHYEVTLKPDTDLVKFAKAANVVVHGSVPLKFADSAFFDPRDKHERGNEMLFIWYSRK